MTGVEEAATVANATAELFIDYIARMNAREDLASLDFLAQQLKESDGSLAEARESLRAFKANSKLVDLSTETAAIISLISDLNT